MVVEDLQEDSIARFEEPDIWYSKFTTKGQVGLLSTKLAIPLARDLFDRRRDIYWIHNNGEAIGISADARRWFQEQKIVLRPYAFVVCGGSFRVRTLCSLMVRGLKLLGQFEGQVVTFKTEEEARLWVERDRAKRT